MYSFLIIFELCVWYCITAPPSGFYSSYQAVALARFLINGEFHKKERRLLRL